MDKRTHTLWQRRNKESLAPSKQWRRCNGRSYPSHDLAFQSEWCHISEDKSTCPHWNGSQNVLSNARFNTSQEVWCRRCCSKRSWNNSYGVNQNDKTWNQWPKFLEGWKWTKDKNCLWKNVQYPQRKISNSCPEGNDGSSKRKSKPRKRWNWRPHFPGTVSTHSEGISCT